MFFSIGKNYEVLIGPSLSKEALGGLTFAKQLNLFVGLFVIIEVNLWKFDYKKI